MESGTYYWFEGVWGSSANDVFAVGGHDMIFHFNGTGWSSMKQVDSASPNGVWGSSANDVFVVGTLGIILHYDGNPKATWSRMDNYSP